LPQKRTQRVKIFLQRNIVGNPLCLSVFLFFSLNLSKHCSLFFSFASENSYKTFALGVLLNLQFNLGIFAIIYYFLYGILWIAFGIEYILIPILFVDHFFHFQE